MVSLRLEAGPVVALAAHTTLVTKQVCGKKIFWDTHGDARTLRRRYKVTVVMALWSLGLGWQCTLGSRARRRVMCEFLTKR